MMRASCLVSLCLSAIIASAAAISNELQERATGIVTRSGTGFVLDGKPFYFMGTNSYWLDGLSNGDITSLFSQMNAAGMKVLRIFAWSDNVGGPQDSSFQYWSGANNAPNPAAFAAHMDPIIAAAEAAGIKLVIPMIGNWGPSISLYIQQILGSSATHDTFFSNTQIINAYKRYVSFFVNRYKNSPAVFAWELCNEPRCTGDDNRGKSSACGTAMLTSWISTMSSYIKSIDSQHMVTVGDEGWFTSAQGYGTAYPYQGSDGIDWVSNLKLSTIDYGTFHMYPTGWGQADSWGSTWIQQHAAQGAAIGKPVVLEEFGTANAGSRYSIVGAWLDAGFSSGLNGIQYWQFVGSFPSGYKSPDDGNGISTSESTYSLIEAMAVKMNAKSGSGGGGGGSTTTAKSSPTTTTTPAKSTTAVAGGGGGGTVQHWGQCGGIGWTGGTVCVSPYSCTYSNAWYSQCL